MNERVDKGNSREKGSRPGHGSGHSTPQFLENKETVKRTQANQTRKRPPKAPTLPHRLHSSEDSARYLGVSSWTLREMIWRNDLPHVKIGRRQFLDVRDLDQFIEQAKVREK